MADKTYMYGISDLAAYQVNDRIELHPATDLWMRGARFGTIKKIGHKYLTVHVDAIGRNIRLSADNVFAII